MKNKSSSAWSVAKSEEHYGFKRWGSGHVSVDDEGFVNMQPLADGRGIRVLDMTWCNQLTITDAGLAHLVGKPVRVR